MIKCVVFDIGNTIISKNGNNEVDPVLKSDIERLRGQGLIVGVASMRTLALSKKALKDIKLDFYICLSGAQIYINNELSYRKSIEFADINHSCSIYYSQDETYALNEKCAIKAKDKGFVVEKIKSSHSDPIYNIALLGIEKAKVELYKKSYHVEYWSKLKVLVLQHLDTSKSKAISFILNYYKITKDEILGFGDGPNDIEFLSVCGTSVAIGHHYKALIDSTNNETDSESKLGVSKALRKLNIIQDTIILFIESLYEVGGMEIHGKNFIEYYKEVSDLHVITHNKGKNTIVFKNGTWYEESISDIGDYVKGLDSVNTMLFFNSGHWISEMKLIRNSAKNSAIFYRTGGNDIISAPPFSENRDPKYRKSFWKNTINQSVDFLITNSSLTEERLRNFGVKKDIFRRVVGGVDIQKILNYKKNLENIKRELGFNINKLNLVSVSRFEPYKRVELLLKTMQYLDPDSYHLYLIGSGSLYDELHSKYSFLVNVSFLGKLDHDNTLKYICSGDYYAQFSGDLASDLYGLRYIHTEGMGRTILEAITAGTPVIATKCGAFPEIVSQMEGLLLDSDNPEELAIKIIEAKMFKFHKKTSELYDFDNVFNSYLRIWRKK